MLPNRPATKRKRTRSNELFLDLAIQKSIMDDARIDRAENNCATDAGIPNESYGIYY
jgi:hypothetical protein